MPQFSVLPYMDDEIYSANAENPEAAVKEVIPINLDVNYLVVDNETGVAVNLRAVKALTELRLV